MAGGLSGALSGLANVYEGYKKGESDEYKLDDSRRTELAKVAMGNALSLLAGGGQNNAAPASQSFGGPQGPAPQPPMPGQPSVPMVQQPRPQGAPGAGPAAATPPSQPMQPQGPGPQPGGGQQGALDWRQLVAAVKQANPNIHPDVLTEAVNQFLPLMNQQSAQEWKNISLQLREQSLQQREDQFRLAEAGRNERADQSAADKAANRDQRQQQFEQREQRLQESLKLREDTTYQRLQQQQDAAIERARTNQSKEAIAAANAAITARDKYLRSKIAAMNSNVVGQPADRKALLDQADENYRQAQEALRAAAGRTTAPSTGTVPDGTPAPPKTSDQVMSQPKPIPFDIRQQYDAALAAGKPKDQLIRRLQEQGYTTDGL